jgi:hypothetical protein
LLISDGCTKSSNSVTPITNQTLTTEAVSDSIQYTFAIPKGVFGIHDTLSATLTAYNQSSKPETLVVGYNPYLYTWSLKNESGRVIMFGPMGANNLLRMISINPNQSSVMYSIHQAIADTSGGPVTAGSYVLQWNLNNRVTTLLSFSLNLSLQ